jgi:hypothetical protein
MTDLASSPRPASEPGIASAEDGVVILDGPAGVAVTMTAGAAAQTGHSLITAAGIAEKQVADKNGDGDV